MNRWHHSLAIALVPAAILLTPGVGHGDPDVPPKGEVEIKVVEVPGSGPRLIMRGLVEQPPRKVWAIVSDCATYKQHMPRVVSSKLLKKVGNKHTCEVTIDMPFPLSNLTAVTEATHEESDKGMKRSWQLVSGDYKYNDGSWEVKPLGDGSTSLVTYQVHAEPKSAVPEFIRERAQKSAMPDLMNRIRSESAKVP